MVNAKHTQCHHLHCSRPIIINTRRMHRVWVLPGSVSGMVLMAKLSQITSTRNALSTKMYSEVALNSTLLPAGKFAGHISSTVSPQKGLCRAVFSLSNHVSH